MKKTIEDVRRRLDETRQEVGKTYAAIGFWEPNDRMVKIFSAHLDNINNYLRELNEEINRCTQQTPKFLK